MKLHSVFLRNGCVLPSRLDPLREAIGNRWSLIEDLPAQVFDTMIRQSGWHFMWIQNSCARRGLGFSRKSATDRALTHALEGIAPRFNAAELNSVQVANCLGLHLATVTLQSRQIQQQTSLDCPNDI